MLSLYYRWALQVLSAFSFLHSRSIYVRSFSSRFVWLRSDFSLAITGFICATAPAIEQEVKTDAAQEARLRKQDRAAVLGMPSSRDEEAFEDEEDDTNISPWF